MPEKSLYERLGGIYAIAAVVDHFSDNLLKNPKIVTPEVFDEVILVELGRALDHFKVPTREKEEVLAAFMAQKADRTAAR